MVDKIQKYLIKLSGPERINLLSVLEQIQSGQYQHLHPKKLTGHQTLFRVRVGKNRVIFDDDGSMVRLVSVSRRNEKTYKKF